MIAVSEKFGWFECKYMRKRLKITIPEDLNYGEVFDDILNKYTQRYSLEKIKTTDLGSWFELSYSIVMKKDVNEQAFINELRCRNGNLNIQLAYEPQKLN